METPPMMTVAQAAQRLGCNPETLRRAIRQGRLACYRFGGCTRLSEEHLRAYLDSALRPARDPKPTGADESGGMAVVLDEFRLKRRIDAALDRPSRAGGGR
jgi:excisionase family DNA binding protein